MILDYGCVILISIIDSSVVQLVEHLTVNQNGVGASPTGGAISGAVAHLGERIPCTDEVASSILVSSTTKELMKLKYIIYLILISIILGLIAGKILAIMYL